MFSKIRGKNPAQTTQNLKKKQEKRLEKQLIKAFQDFGKEIMQDFQVFDVSPQLNNALLFSIKVRAACEKIGKHQTFSKMHGLLHEVWVFDRKVETYTEALKVKHDHNDSSKHRDNIKRDFSVVTNILSTLESIVDEVEQETSLKLAVMREDGKYKKAKKEIDIKLTPNEQVQQLQNAFFDHPVFRYDTNQKTASASTDSESFLEKMNNWRYFQSHKSQKLTSQLEIEAYFTKAEQKQINVPTRQILPENLEIDTMQAVLDKFKFMIEGFEQLAYYNHVQKLGEFWLGHLEELSKKAQAGEYNPDAKVQIIGLLRSRDRNLKEWLERFETKYSDPSKKAASEPKVDSSFLLKLKQYHPNLRRAMIIRIQDEDLYKKMVKAKRKKRVTKLLSSVGMKKQSHSRKTVPKEPKSRKSRKTLLDTKYPIKK